MVELKSTKNGMMECVTTTPRKHDYKKNWCVFSVNLCSFSTSSHRRNINATVFMAMTNRKEKNGVWSMAVWPKYFINFLVWRRWLYYLHICWFYHNSFHVWNVCIRKKIRKNELDSLVCHCPTQLLPINKHTTFLHSTKRKKKKKKIMWNKVFSVTSAHYAIVIAGVKNTFDDHKFKWQ